MLAHCKPCDFFSYISAEGALDENGVGLRCRQRMLDPGDLAKSLEDICRWSFEGHAYFSDRRSLADSWSGVSSATIRPPLMITTR